MRIIAPTKEEFITATRSKKKPGVKDAANIGLLNNPFSIVRTVTFD